MCPLSHEHDIHLSVCNVGGLRSRSATKSAMAGYVDVLATCVQKLSRIVVSCDPEFYEGR